VTSSTPPIRGIVFDFDGVLADTGLDFTSR